MIVVKVGGSLYDHPRLGPGLHDYLNSLSGPVLIVPGGGEFADVIRQLDAVHELGDDASHLLALKAMNLAGEFLKQLIPALVSDPRLTVYKNEFDFTLPHSWDITSDSIAAQAAINVHASRLILLKSVDIPLGMPWPEAAERGWVDPYFSEIIASPSLRSEDSASRLKGIVPVKVVNFRRVLDDASNSTVEQVN